MTARWEETLKERLQLFGHRNWLVVADAAYPAQSRQAIETIVANEEASAVLARTLAVLNEYKHVQANIYTDEELNFVLEQDAPGVSAYREELRALFKEHKFRVLPHEEIIARLDQVGETFRVFLIKTNMRIPYTSIFFELDCGYWNSEAEDRLRAAMRMADRDQARNMAEIVSR